MKNLTYFLRDNAAAGQDTIVVLESLEFVDYVSNFSR